MSTKRVLFVDDEPLILDGMRRMMHPLRDEWSMVFAEGGDHALAEMERSEVDVVISDMNMPHMDGTALLSLVKQRWPATVRVVLSGEADRETAMRTVRVAHQYIAKPCDSEVVRDVVERSCALRQTLSSPALRAVVGGADTLPGLPRVYSALELALSRPNPSVSVISEIIGQDVAITAKLLHISNSAFFGVKTEVRDIETAVNYLGVNVIRSLVLSHEITRTLHNSHAAGLSLDQHQRHALLTAAIARRLPLAAQESDDAFMAAMLHDVGKLLIADRAPVRFAEARAVALARGILLYDAEQLLYSASHAEAGAALLGIWGLPHAIVAGVAYHHNPGRTGSTSLDVVAAVHIANGLAHEVSITQNQETSGPPALDEGFVGRIGCASELPEWRMMVAALA